MADAKENSDVNKNVFEEFKAKIAEANYPTTMGE